VGFTPLEIGRSAGDLTNSGRRCVGGRRRDGPGLLQALPESTAGATAIVQEGDGYVKQSSNLPKM
jgi:hypothetical protein